MNAKTGELASRIRKGIAELPSAPALKDTAKCLRKLCDLAYSDNGPGIFLSYQRLLFDLHYGNNEETYWMRQWLATQVYDLEHARTPREEILRKSVSSKDLEALLAKEQTIYSPLKHPLFNYLFNDKPTFDEFKVYLKHKWIIIQYFWKSFAEFAQRLSRTEGANLENVSLIYKNIWDELGKGDTNEAHLLKHYRQLRSIGVSIKHGEMPRYPETFDYINTRIRLMRHPDRAWGLGCFYSQEITSLEYTLGHYHLLKKFKVSEKDANIYFIHDKIDAEHCSDILKIIGSLATTVGEQNACILAHRFQLQRWLLHFDRVLGEIMNSNVERKIPA